jgi:hypothetical protein
MSGFKMIFFLISPLPNRPLFVQSVDSNMLIPELTPCPKYRPPQKYKKINFHAKPILLRSNTVAFATSAKFPRCLYSTDCVVHRHVNVTIQNVIQVQILHCPCGLVEFICEIDILLTGPLPTGRKKPRFFNLYHL